MPDHLDSELPEPLPGEEETIFLARCMSDSRMTELFPDKGQRAAVARGQWYKAGAEAEEEHHTTAIQGVEQPAVMHIPASVKFF
jgi:hypothetical protein